MFVTLWVGFLHGGPTSGSCCFPAVTILHSAVLTAVSLRLLVKCLGVGSCTGIDDGSTAVDNCSSVGDDGTSAVDDWNTAVNDGINAVEE